MKILFGIVAIVAICIGIALLFHRYFIFGIITVGLGIYVVYAYKQESNDPFADIRIWWQKHYRAQHGIELDLSQVSIPSKPNGDDWILLCIAQDLTPNHEFNSWSFPKMRARRNLNALAYKNARDTTETYFIWVRNGPEPDVEFLGQSVSQADPDMKIGMTLLERLVFQSYAHHIGFVLDKKGSTLCSGSPLAGGYVPCVLELGDGRVGVLWRGYGECDSSDGVRRAVYS